MEYIEERALSWHHLLDLLPDGIAFIDKQGFIRHVNENLLTMTGYPHDELVGQPVEILVPARQRAKHAAHWDAVAPVKGTRQMGAGLEPALVRRDGSELAIDVALGAIQIEGEPWLVAAIRDDATRREAEQARIVAEELIAAALSEGAELLAVSDRRCRSSFEHNMSPIIFTDLDDRVVEANDAFCELLGRTRDELIGHDSRSFTMPEDVGISEGSLVRASEHGADQVRYSKRYLHKDGRTVDVEVSRSAARDEDGELLYFVVSARDITDRVKRDHLLRLVTEVNRLAMIATDEMEFLEQLCEALVDLGGYALAWIAVAPARAGDDVDFWCAAGATEYIYGLDPSWLGSDKIMQGPTGTALATGTSQVIDDLVHHARFQPWSERAASYGFGSMAAIPDRIGDRRAALVLYHHGAHEFDELKVKGLEEIVREAEFAITHIRSVLKTEAALEETTAAVSALRESEERFRLAFENNMAPMVFSDLEDRVIAVNDAFCDMVGFTREQLMGEDSKQFTYPEDVGITEESHVSLMSDEVDQVRYVKRYLRSDGHVLISEVSRSVARDASGRTLYFVSSERDVTDERALTEQLSHQVFHDPLTGLANRALFEDRLAHAHARAVRHGGMGAVLMLDLDDFKGVNETHGHLVGDQLLVAIAQRFEMVTRSSDTLCRFGGDEFLYLAEGMTNPSEAEDVAARLLDALVEPFSIVGIEITQSASVGIVVWDGESQRFGEFVQDADVALYETKRRARGSYTIFDPTMHQQVARDFALVQELRHALVTGELAMHYQPIVDLATTGVVGFEALMRWQHPVRGPIPPTVFIALAEQSDLILELGAFAMRESAVAASSWGPVGDATTLPYVTVNVSAHQFHDRGLLALTKEALRTSALAPERLMIEITESVTQVDMAETMDVIRQLKELGVHFALDDFGTGYSSLSYLALLSPRIIKIDKSFVNPATENEHHETLLETIILLGHKLGKIMLAEGIETAEHLAHVRRLGCDLGQGFLFSAAVPNSEATSMIGRVFGECPDDVLASD